jgi:hypothetical protein
MVRKSKIKPLKTFTMANGRPKDTCTMSLATRRPAIHIADGIVASGFSFANQATMIAT